MVAPGSKKSSGVHKKGNIAVEDENCNGKRTGRTTRPGTVPVLSTLTSDVKPNLSMPPKHIPIPYIPQDGEILFEVMSFMFTLVATGLQFLNLYRTAWWLPNSNQDQAMHFYLIDSHLVAFIVVFHSRRLLFSVTLVLLKLTVAPKMLTHVSTASRMFVLGVIMGVLAWCLYFLANKHSFMKIFFLCYPSVIYFSLFGFTSGPFLEFNNPDTPLHSCSHDPDQIRAEVDLLREDFNLKVKKIIFNSVVGAYYSSFIPCIFVQPTVQYSVYSASTVTALALGGAAARDTQRHVGTAPALRRAAAHLGTWVECGGSAPAWCGSRLWARGARAGVGPRTYEAAAPQVAAEPGNYTHRRFYLLFNNPSTLLSVILCLQLGLIVLQLCLLFSSLLWHYFVSIVILLFFNYYTLFKAARDYLIAWKIYKAEAMILEKNSPLHTN